MIGVNVNIDCTGHFDRARVIKIASDFRAPSRTGVTP